MNTRELYIDIMSFKDNKNNIIEFDIIFTNQDLNWDFIDRWIYIKTTYNKCIWWTSYQQENSSQALVVDVVASTSTNCVLSAEFSILNLTVIPDFGDHVLTVILL